MVVVIFLFLAIFSCIVFFSVVIFTICVFILVVIFVTIVFSFVILSVSYYNSCLGASLRGLIRYYWVASSSLASIAAGISVVPFALILINSRFIPIRIALLFTSRVIITVRFFERQLIAGLLLWHSFSLFLWWVVDIVVVVVAAKLIISVLVELVAIRVEETPIWRYVEPLFVIVGS